MKIFEQYHYLTMGCQVNLSVFFTSSGNLNVILINSFEKSEHFKSPNIR